MALKLDSYPAVRRPQAEVQRSSIKAR